MHLLSELIDWEKMFKIMVWKQLGEINGRKILDFGSGQGITANHFAKNNDVVAVEPSNEMLNNAWTDFQYEQIVGDVSALQQNQNKHSIEDWQAKMLQLEERVSIIKEYKEIASFHHIIFTKE